MLVLLPSFNTTRPYQPHNDYTFDSTLYIRGDLIFTGLTKKIPEAISCSGDLKFDSF